MNVNISNELNFSDVYRSVNYIGSLAKLHESIRGSFTLHATQCSLHFDKPQKNEIHFLNNVYLGIIVFVVQPTPLMAQTDQFQNYVQFPTELWMSKM